MWATFNHLRLQFSLRAAFLLITALCVLLAWGVHAGGRRHRAILHLRRAGASLEFRHKLENGVYHEHAQPPGSPFLKLLFGEYYATQVRWIETIYPRRFTDVEAREAATFTELDWLAISGSPVTDDGLDHLAKLTHLRRLDIEGCNVSKEGVKRLRRALPKTDIYSDYSMNSRAGP